MIYHHELHRSFMAGRYLSYAHENDTVLLALKRLPPNETYDRVFRLRRAFQVEFSMARCSMRFSRSVQGQLVWVIAFPDDVAWKKIQLGE